MRTAFDEQLKILHDEMILMSNLCEVAIAKAVTSFIDGDLKLSESVIKTAIEIDRKEREIETMCMKLLLMQHPVARDLRVISSALKMVTDLERIGNQSADIAEIVKTCKFPDIIKKDTIHDMALATIKMVNDSVESFQGIDTVKAKEIIAYDDVVDDYFNQIKSSLIDDLKNGRDIGEYGIDLLMIAKYLERIGDHAVNIAKWVLFSDTGVIENIT